MHRNRGMACLWCRARFKAGETQGKGPTESRVRAAEKRFGKAESRRQKSGLGKWSSGGRKQIGKAESERQKSG